MGVQATPSETKTTTLEVEKIPVYNGAESRDSLLKDFSAGQRDYILHKLYPVLKKTLVHFIAEATLNNQIVEREETLAEEVVDPSEQDSFSRT